jgi:hypothetical protein
MAIAVGDTAVVVYGGWTVIAAGGGAAGVGGAAAGAGTDAAAGVGGAAAGAGTDAAVGGEGAVNVTITVAQESPPIAAYRPLGRAALQDAVESTEDSTPSLRQQACAFGLAVACFFSGSSADEVANPLLHVNAPEIRLLDPLVPPEPVGLPPLGPWGAT